MFECQSFMQVTPKGVVTLDAQMSHSAPGQIPAESILLNRPRSKTFMYDVKKYSCDIKLSRRCE